MTDTPEMTGRMAAECLAAFRTKQPRVHCITNVVAQHFTANVLLAAGAVPSMTIAADEVEDFARRADALLVNLGTLDEQRKEAAARAIAVAHQEMKPWALDPVFVEASDARLFLAQSMLLEKPNLVRCNEAEAQAMAGGDAAVLAAKMPETVFAVTGAPDRVFKNDRSINVQNSHEIMRKVTATGCALNAVAAGFLSAAEKPVIAVSAALAFYGLAAERAAEKASGPGTFVPHFLDELSAVTPEELEAGARFE